MEDIDGSVVAVWMVGPLLYMLPTIVYRARVGLRRLWTVPGFALLNVVLGWTVIGWFYLLARAMGAAPEVRRLESWGLATEARPENVTREPPRAPVPDSSARSEIVTVLERSGSAELHHEASGVRVRVTLLEPAESGSGYRLEVPTASLDPRRGQRHRARRAVEDIAWRVYDGAPELGPAPGGLADDAETWEVSREPGGAGVAAGEALRLLCSIADLPLDTPVTVSA